MRAWLMIAPLVILLAGCSTAEPLPPWQARAGLDHPDVGQIVDLQSGEVLSPVQLVRRLGRTPMLLVGEQHDNPDHHRLQAWLLQALAAERGRGPVLLEMLNPDQQGRIEQVQQAYAAGVPPADLQDALAWQTGWDWALYGPLVTGLLQQGVPLLAANLDRDEIKGIYHAPGRLSGRHSTALEVGEVLSQTIRTSHCGMLPETQVPAMLAIQQHRDRRMAERLLAAPAPAVLLAGAFHTRRDLGVPLHLQDLAPEADYTVLQLAEAGDTVRVEQADLVWYTPAVPPVDHCEQMRGSRRP